MISFLAFKSFRNRKLITALSIFSIALSISLFLAIGKVRQGIENGFTNSISNADLIVGARSGQLQLLLYTIFHMGSPTNNISMKTYETIDKHPAVKWTIPISLGDSYKGHRVVATNSKFIEHYNYAGDKNLKLTNGKWFSGTYQVVMGSQVAKKLKHKLGDKIILSHGIEATSFVEHDDFPFVVSGLLAPTGTPIDKSVFISLEGMEAIHAGNGNDGVVTQITSFILKSKSPFALLRLQRSIALFKDEPLSAIIPAVALSEVWRFLDQIEVAFKVVGFFVAFVGLITMLILLFISLDYRNREMAILRTLGTSPINIVQLILVESIIILVIGVSFAFALNFILLSMIQPYLLSEYSILIPITAPSESDYKVVLLFICIGTLFGLIPALKGYFISLNKGLGIKY